MKAYLLVWIEHHPTYHQGLPFIIPVPNDFLSRSHPESVVFDNLEKAKEVFNQIALKDSRNLVICEVVHGKFTE